MKQILVSISLLFFLSFAASAAPDSREGALTDGKGHSASFELDPLTKRAVDRSAAELIVEPNGDLTLALNGSHQHVYMARLGAGGKIETYCASSEKAVRRFLFERRTHQE